MTDTSFEGSLQFNNTTISNEILCNPLVPSYRGIALAIIPLLQIIVNGFVFIATFRSRQKLRHNYVYAYVMNSLVGNLVFALVSLYNLLDLAFVFERVWSSSEPFRIDQRDPNQVSLQTLWAFRSSFILGIYLLTNLSVSALIYGIRGSSYLVGRYLEDPSRVRDSIDKRKTKAVVIITTIWIAAIGISLAGVFGAGNCLTSCVCVYAEYDAGFEYCRTLTQKHCSRVWRPVTNPFLITVAVIWCLEMLFILFMLLSTLRKLRRILNPRTQNSLTQSNVNTTCSTNQDGSQSITENSVTSSDFASTSVKEKLDLKKKISCGCEMSNRTIQFLFVLSLILFLTEFPAILSILINMSIKEHIVTENVFIIMTAITMLYGFLLPIIMVYYMPRLRQAVENLFLSIKCCTKTVSEQKRPHVS